MEIIALRTVKYNDKHSILSALSAEKGRVSLFVPASASREARRRRALLQPLSIAECEINFQATRDIHNIVDIKPSVPTPAICMDPVRAMLAIFLADFFSAILRDSPPDPVIFRFVKELTVALDVAPKSYLPTFHLLALSRFATLAGVEPDGSTYAHGRIFDLQDGLWRTTPPLHARWLEADEAHFAHFMLHASARHISRLRLTRGQRALILDKLLEYYTLHFTELHLPSLAVLRDFT